MKYFIPLCLIGLMGLVSCNEDQIIEAKQQIVAAPPDYLYTCPKPSIPDTYKPTASDV